MIATLYLIQLMHTVAIIINTATGKDDKLHNIFELHYIELKKFNGDAILIMQV